MADKRSIIFIAVSSISLTLIYLFLIFFLELSYFAYSAINLIFALIAVLVLSRIVKEKDSYIKKGWILSLIVGVILFISNILIYILNYKVSESGMVSLFNAPNPFIFFILFIVLFNIPFLLSSKLSIGITSLISIMIILCILLSSPIYSLSKLGCISFTCNEDGCFCRYTNVISEGKCPECSSLCAEKGKVKANTTLPLSKMPLSVERTPDGGFKAEGGQVQCFCYCK